MKHVDYIVVGGGISGAVLSYTLMKYGASVLLYDLPDENMSSKVAAGLWNPIVLKRLKKVWRADEMMDELSVVYPDIEAWTGASFYDPVPIRRVFHNAGEQNDWLGLTSSEAFARYLNDEIAALPEGIIGDHQSGLMKETGRLRVHDFMSAVRSTLSKEDSFVQERFEWSKVLRDAEGITYGEVRAHAVISCEGTQLALGKSDLKIDGFAPVKGEVIRIKLDKDLGTECIHQGHFMLSEGEKEATVGATYAWDGFYSGPTSEKKEELVDHVHKVYHGDFEVIGHQVGVRPATKDRRPMVGPLEDLEHTYIFGGMGSRAVLMAPYLARKLSEHFMYGAPLLEECLPQRF